LVTPILARLYSPADFGFFGLFLSLSLVLGTIATLRYTQALFLPETNSEVSRMALLCLVVTTALSVIVFAGYICAKAAFEKLPGSGASFAAGLALSTLIAGVQQTLYALANRWGYYSLMTLSKISQAAGIAIITVVIAVFVSRSASGLIVGHLAGQILGIIPLLPMGKRLREELPSRERAEIIGLGLKYKEFVFLSLPSTLINAITNQLPILFVTLLFSSDVLGQYNLMMRVTFGPLALISLAFLDVFKERASREYREHGSCRAIFLRGALMLAIIGIPCLILFYPFAPGVFTMLFGNEWRDAGELAKILTPLFIARFIVSPLSFVIYVSGNQRLELIWQITLSAVVFSALSIGASSGDFMHAMRWFSICYAVMYCFYFWINLSLTDKTE
jgi:O-antigen/teichoic acid export membrane protein